MVDFKDCLDRCGLVDLGFEGHKFTWSNKQAGVHNIQERLDRGLANSDWIARFPLVWVQHLQPVLSDHCPILIQLVGLREGQRKKRVRCFKFEKMWLQEGRCRDIVVDNWDGVGMTSLSALDDNI